VFLDLKAVSDISIDAITALIAWIHNAYNQHLTAVRGNTPDDLKARTILDQSGFFAHLSSRRPPSSYGKISQQRSSKRVEPHVARDLIHFATAAAVGSSQRCQAAYRVLIEGMNNTHNHASGKHHEREIWWATVYADSSQSRISFAFLDTGVGIFKSIRLDAIRKIYQSIGISNRSDLLKDILAGEVESRTGERHRGKGLPAIYRLLKEGRLSALSIVANDVHADIGGSIYNTLRISFRGTLLYWEIQLPSRMTP
jgi:hypothetical protein